MWFWTETMGWTGTLLRNHQKLPQLSKLQGSQMPVPHWEFMISTVCCCCPKQYCAAFWSPEALRITLLLIQHENSNGFDLNISYLSTSQLTVGSSILLISTMRCRTPAVFTSIACSRVWPPRSKPVSNSPLRADITCTHNTSVFS